MTLHDGAARGCGARRAETAGRIIDGSEWRGRGKGRPACRMRRGVAYAGSGHDVLAFACTLPPHPCGSSRARHTYTHRLGPKITLARRGVAGRDRRLVTKSYGGCGCCSSALLQRQQAVHAAALPCRLGTFVSARYSAARGGACANGLGGVRSRALHIR